MHSIIIQTPSDEKRHRNSILNLKNAKWLKCNLMKSFKGTLKLLYGFVWDTICYVNMHRKWSHDKQYSLHCKARD